MQKDPKCPNLSKIIKKYFIIPKIFTYIFLNKNDEERYAKEVEEWVGYFLDHVPWPDCDPTGKCYNILYNYITLSYKILIDRYIVIVKMFYFFNTKLFLMHQLISVFFYLLSVFPLNYFRQRKIV